MALTAAQIAVCSALFGVVVGGTGVSVANKASAPKKASGGNIAAKAPTVPAERQTFNTGTSIINVWGAPVVGSLACPDVDYVNIPTINSPPGSKPGNPGTIREEPSIIGGITAIPEPDTWVMLLSGFGFIGLAIRRKKRIVQ
jgi:hypothetical protein